MIVSVKGSRANKLDCNTGAMQALMNYFELFFYVKSLFGIRGNNQIVVL